MSRVRQRLFPPRSAANGAAPCPDLARRVAAPPVPAPRRVGFQAGIAEFLLVNRLRARRPSEVSAEVRERAAHIVFVTCKHWFANPESGGHVAGHHTRI